MRGTVESFDEGVGLGVIGAADGSTYPFHCTQLADGTRSIATGVSVSFDVMPGRAGRWEATAIQRC